MVSLFLNIYGAISISTEQFSGLDSLCALWYRTLRLGHRLWGVWVGNAGRLQCCTLKLHWSYWKCCWWTLDFRGQILSSYIAINKHGLKIRKAFLSIDVTLKKHTFWCHDEVKWSVSAEDSFWNLVWRCVGLHLPPELLHEYRGKNPQGTCLLWEAGDLDKWLNRDADVK